MESSSPKSTDTDYKPDLLIGDSVKENPNIFVDTATYNLAELSKKPPAYRTLDTIVENEEVLFLLLPFMQVVLTYAENLGDKMESWKVPKRMCVFYRLIAQKLRLVRYDMEIEEWYKELFKALAKAREHFHLAVMLHSQLSKIHAKNDKDYKGPLRVMFVLS